MPCPWPLSTGPTTQDGRRGTFGPHAQGFRHEGTVGVVPRAFAPYDVPVSDHAPEITRVRTLMSRLRRTGARLAASRRRREVIEVVGTARTDEQAAEAVSDLLDVDPAEASVVIDMPVRSFTEDRVADLEAEHQRLEQRLATLRTENP